MLGCETLNELLKLLDQKQTILAVKRVFIKYRQKIVTISEERTPRITASYTVEMPETTSVEKVAIENIETERAAIAFFTYFSNGLKKLTLQERQIISMFYLNFEPNYAYQIANQLNISERTFHRVKRLALLKLALALGVAVYKEDEEFYESS